MITSGTTNEKGWQKNENECQQMTASDKTKVENFKTKKDQSGSWIILFNFLCNI